MLLYYILYIYSVLCFMFKSYRKAAALQIGIIGFTTSGSAVSPFTPRSGHSGGCSTAGGAGLHTMPSQKHTTYLQKSRWQVNLHPPETVRHMHTAAGPLPQAHPTANPAADSVHLCCEPRKGLGIISLSHTVRQMKAKRSIF